MVYSSVNFYISECPHLVDFIAETPYFSSFGPSALSVDNPWKRAVPPRLHRPPFCHALSDFSIFFSLRYNENPQPCTIRSRLPTMAPIKRKGNAPEESAARQPQKRAKVGAEESKKDSKPQDSAPKASELSVLRDDEPSFPRGGGSVLTPLERKQIQIQANKDVLFEQKGQKKQTREFDDDNDDDEDDVDMEDGETTTTAKKSRKKKTKGKKSAEQDKPEKEGVRIEPLSYKV